MYATEKCDVKQVNSVKNDVMTVEFQTTRDDVVKFKINTAVDCSVLTKASYDKMINKLKLRPSACHASTGAKREHPVSDRCSMKLKDRAAANNIYHNPTTQGQTYQHPNAIQNTSTKPHLRAHSQPQVYNSQKNSRLQARIERGGSRRMPRVRRRCL